MGEVGLRLFLLFLSHLSVDRKRPCLLQLDGDYLQEKTII